MAKSSLITSGLDKAATSCGRSRERSTVLCSTVSKGVVSLSGRASSKPTSSRECTGSPQASSTPISKPHRPQSIRVSTRVLCHSSSRSRSSGDAGPSSNPESEWRYWRGNAWPRVPRAGARTPSSQPSLRPMARPSRRRCSPRSLVTARSRTGAREDSESTISGSFRVPSRLSSESFVTSVAPFSPSRRRWVASTVAVPSSGLASS